MGAWGSGLFSDDLACDVRDAFRDAIGDGLTTFDAVERVKRGFADSLNDQDEQGVFWLALAVTAWNVGRLEEDVKLVALQQADSGKDLDRWEDPKLKRQRQAVLSGIAAKLQSPQRSPTKIAKRIRSTNDWALGELVGFRLRSGRWTLLHVVDEFTDDGGTVPCCELIDWVGDKAPKASEIAALGVVAPRTPHLSHVFMFQPPRKPVDKARLARWGLFRKKAPFALTAWLRAGKKADPRLAHQGQTVFVWPFVDQQFLQVFGLE